MVARNQTKLSGNSEQLFRLQTRFSSFLVPRHSFDPYGLDVNELMNAMM